MYFLYSPLLNQLLSIHVSCHWGHASEIIIFIQNHTLPYMSLLSLLDQSYLFCVIPSIPSSIQWSSSFLGSIKAFSVTNQLYMQLNCSFSLLSIDEQKLVQLCEAEMVKGVQKLPCTTLHTLYTPSPSLWKKICIWCICWFVFCRTCLVLCSKYDYNYEHYTSCLFLLICHLNFEVFLILFREKKKNTGSFVDVSRL